MIFFAHFAPKSLNLIGNWVPKSLNLQNHLFITLFPLLPVSPTSLTVLDEDSRNLMLGDAELLASAEMSKRLEKEGGDMEAAIESGRELLGIPVNCAYKLVQYLVVLTLHPNSVVLSAHFLPILFSFFLLEIHNNITVFLHPISQ